MKKIIIMLFSILTSILVFAHNPNITITDNKDGTFTVSAIFPNGDSTEGTNVYILQDKPYNGSSDTIDGNLILFTRDLDENGKVTLYKPKTKKYYIHLYVMVDHEYDREDVPILTKEEMPEWENKIKNDKSLTEDEKGYLLGTKKD